MDFFEAIHSRRAIRDYRADPVPADVIEEIIDEAIQAPSSNNRQAWSFLVVRGGARLGRYAEEALAVLPAERRAILHSHLDASGHGIFYNAPALVLISATEADPMVAQDCCLAAQTFMLAAHARGLGTCWIGSAEAWLALPAARAELGLPARYVPVAPILLGYPRTTPQPTARRTPEIVWLGEDS